MPTPVPLPLGFDPEDYFRDKTVRIVANSLPGDDTDTQTRVMAAFMGQHIPGNPRVLVTNQPDKQLEYVFAATTAQNDGTYISFTSTLQIESGFEETTRYIKRSTFQAIGSLTTPPQRALWLPPGTPYHIAGVIAAAFEEASTTDQELIARLTSISGEPINWLGRDALQAVTLERERQFGGS